MSKSTLTQRGVSPLNYKASVPPVADSKSFYFRFLTFVLGFLVFFVAFARATDVGSCTYCDKNGNGSYNSGAELKPAVLGVKVYSKATSTLLKTTSTNASGFYNADPINNGTQVAAKIAYNGTTHSVTAISNPSTGLTYTWSVPGGGTNPGDVASLPTIQEGTYSAPVKNNSNGFTTSENTEVVSDTTACFLTMTNPLPTAESICAGASVTLSATTNAVSPVEIEWVRFDSEVADPYTATGNGKTALGSVVPSGGTASISSTNFPAVNGQIKTYYVYACFKNAPDVCKGFVKHQIDVLEPTVTATGGAISCTTTSVQLTATGSPTSGVASSYNWTGPGGFTSTTQNPVVSVAGSYEVAYSTTKDGATCTVKAAVTVTGNTAAPNANAGADCVLTCTTATLNADPFPGAQWSQVGTTPSVIIFANVSDPNTTVSGLSVGTYTLVWKAGDCADTLVIVAPDCNVDCIKPEAGPDVNVCAPATTAKLPDAGMSQAWMVGAQNPAPATIDPQTGAISGLTNDGMYSFILADSNIGSTCADTVFIFRGIPNVPDDQSTCSDTLTLTAVAGGTYSVLAGNPATAAITPAGKASGLTALGMYKFLLTQGQCTDTVKVQKLNCTRVYDLALDKAVSKKTAQLGDTLTYTIRVWNEGEAAAHGIEVTDTLNAGVQYVSYTSTIGNYSAGKWNFDSIAVGDTVSLNVLVRVVAQGVWFNTAEITTMAENDKDSTPGNGEEGEDDIDRECFAVPIEVCRGQAYVATVPVRFTSVVWFKEGQQVATGNSYAITESGEYTFTATGAQCPAQGCCPILVAVIDCCPENVCVPVVIRKTRTATR